jgi:hypothetical protein
VVFLLGLLHATAYALLTPRWQAPDEPGHMEYACLMAQLGQVPEAEDRSGALQTEIIGSLAHHDFWRRVRQPQPDPLPPGFAADAFLVRSGQQVDDEPPLYYAVAALLCRVGQRLPMATRLVLVRLLGALLFGFTGVVTAWAWRSAFGIQQAVLLVLLPMPAFIAGSANNDVLAMLTATAVFAAVVRLQRLGWSWRRLAGLAALLVLALLSKKTNAFLVPWLALVGLASGWQRLHTLPTPRAVRRWVVVSLAVSCGLVVLFLLLPSQAPAGWSGNLQPLGQGRVAVQRDPPEWAALVVDQSTHDTGRLFQSVVAPRALALRGQQVVASINVRSPDSQLVQPGRLTVRDAAGWTQTAFTATSAWQRITLTHTVAPTTTYVKLILAPYGGSAAATGSLLVDDARLEAPLLPQPDGNALRNPGFERPARWGELLLVAPFVRRWEQFIPRLYAGDAFTVEAFPRYLLYTALLVPGFWGNFGWLQRPLPIWLYAALALVCLLAGLGLLRRARQRAAPHLPAQDTGDQAPASCNLQPAACIPSWLLAVGLILVQTLLPMIGRDWQPQGRYLFPALFPITGLLLVGLHAWLDFDQRPRRLGAALALLLALDLVSLLRAAFIL